MSGKGQIAVEFLTTYSFAILIIVIIIAVLVLFVSLPKTILPTQCTFYSGFNCIDAAFGQNTLTGQGVLVVLASDSQIGVVNSISFNAVVGSENSTSGSCTPAQVSAGQSLVCIANFGFSPSLQNVYSGTFGIHANYCPQDISTTNCTASGNFIYSGAFRIQAIPVNTLFYNVSVHSSGPPPLTWTLTAPYPGVSGVADQGCATSGGYIYCVGGTDGVYIDYDYFGGGGGPATSNGIPSWMTNYIYPGASGSGYADGSCVVSGELYCISGIAYSFPSANPEYYIAYNAPISGNAIGPFGFVSYPTGYPVAAFNPSCIADYGYIDCVGGAITNTPPYVAGWNGVYYNTAGLQGLGPSWSTTTLYPIAVTQTSCNKYTASGNDYIVCVGGYDATHSLYSNAVYYAMLSPSGGISGSWTATSNYPQGESGGSCAAYNNYLYCVGGYNTSGMTTNDVYYAPLSASGVGTWKQTAPYPFGVESQQCEATGGYIYCIGGVGTFPGYTNDVYYASLSSSGVG